MEIDLGVFVNNYDNFVLWVNLADQLKLVSAAQGQDIKYVLLRLQKAAVRIEEAIKVGKKLCLYNYFMELVYLSLANRRDSQQITAALHTARRESLVQALRSPSPSSCQGF